MLGIRVPDNNIIREICHLLDAPILTTTLPLNPDEDVEYVTDPELIDEKFGLEVDLVIDGGIGGVEPSTYGSRFSLPSSSRFYGCYYQPCYEG